MTQISIIAGLAPTDEISNRAAEVQPAPYFNPLLMTEGQAYLTLMRNQALTLSQYYPDRKFYRKAVVLADNALHAGIGMPLPIGSVDPTLYPVMRAINIFKTKRQPAVMLRPGSSVGSWANESLVAGVIPEVSQEFALWWWMNDQAYLKTKFKNAQNLKVTLESFKNGPPLQPRNEFEKRWVEFSGKYDTLKFVIDLYNRKIEQFAHHPLYNFLPAGRLNDYPTQVITKNILHAAGVQGCANAGEFSVQNMALWTRNGILNSNIAGNAGALSPEQTAFQLTGLPAKDYTAWLSGNVTVKSDRSRPGINGSDDAIGNPVAIAIIALISAAIAAAAQIITSFNSKNIAAMNSVSGWGTQAYAASDTDWAKYQAQVLESQNLPQTEGGVSWPLVAAGGAAAYLILSK